MPPHIQPLPARGKRVGELCGNGLHGRRRDRAQGSGDRIRRDASVGQRLPRFGARGERTQADRHRLLFIVPPNPLADGAVILQGAPRFCIFQPSRKRRIAL